jgi:hypothetical protein
MKKHLRNQTASTNSLPESATADVPPAARRATAAARAVRNVRDAESRARRWLTRLLTRGERASGGGGDLEPSRRQQVPGSAGNGIPA